MRLLKIPIKHRNGIKATACAQKVYRSVTSHGLSEDVRVYSDSQLPFLLLTVCVRLHSEGCATFSWVRVVAGAFRRACL